MRQTTRSSRSCSRRFPAPRKAMGLPPLLDVLCAREMLKDRFQVMARLLIATKAEVSVERRKKSTAATLVSALILRKYLRLFWPLIEVCRFRNRIRPTIGNDD